ncbi:hypothetical protein [Mesoaciditoga sp.]
MVDRFFSYKKDKGKRERTEVEKNLNNILGELMEILALKIAAKIDRNCAGNKEKVQIKEKIIRVPDKRSFREILEEEVAKFDSIEEVEFLGEYLINFWKELHLK